jgi:putative IMPACT (imprinted ancient) family translation regulator
MYRILSNFSHKNIEKSFFITIVPSLEEANKLVAEIKNKKKPFKNIQTSYSIEESKNTKDSFMLI